MDSSSTSATSTSATDIPKRNVPSLLSVLQQAAPSNLSHKRVIRNNFQLKENKQKTSATGSSSDLKSVTSRDRCNQFPKGYFTVSDGKLFCACCREKLSLNLVALNITSILINMKRVAKRKVSDKTLADHLQVYEHETNPKSETQTESYISCIE